MSGPIALVFPDAAAVACACLAAGLPAQGFDGVPCGTRVPDPRPAAFVRVLRTGGPPDTEVTDLAQLTIEAWSDDEGNAQDIAQVCRALLRAAVGSKVNGATVCGYEEMNGPQNLPDPTSAMSRYTFTVRYRLRGTALA
jgi:hypothetical protein